MTRLCYSPAARAVGRRAGYSSILVMRQGNGVVDNCWAMGLFSYKKALHPVRTTRRAAVRTITPKPVRKVRRAVTTVRHPVSLLEGTAKAELSRTVSRSTRSRGSSRSKGGSSGGGAATVIGVLIVLGLVLVGISAAVDAVSGPHVKAGPQAWVRGGIRYKSSGNYATIIVSNVRCRWNGSHVEAQMRVRNLRRKGIGLTVSPQYTLAGHGSHGGSMDGHTDVGIRARATRPVLVDAGEPEGVSGDQPTITSCGPDLVSLSTW